MLVDLTSEETLKSWLLAGTPVQTVADLKNEKWMLYYARNSVEVTALTQGQCLWYQAKMKHALAEYNKSSSDAYWNPAKQEFMQRTSALLPTARKLYTSNEKFGQSFLISKEKVNMGSYLMTMLCAFETFNDGD